jgi:hypothetical protein
MADYCFRLLFRLGTRIASEARAIELSLNEFSRPLTISGRIGALKDSRQLVAVSCGFTTIEEARSEGMRLLETMLVGGVVQSVPVDFGVGNKRGQWSDAIKEAIRATTGETLRDEVEGLDVYEGGNVTFISVGGEAAISVGPEYLSELVAYGSVRKRPLDERQRIAAELINDSLFEVSGDASFMLRVAAVEALCPQGPPPDEFVTLAKTLSQLIPRDTASEYAQSMRQLLADRARRQTVRGAYMSRIKSLLGDEKARQFDALYEKRSKFLHDGIGRGKMGSPAEKALHIARELLLADIALP